MATQGADDTARVRLALDVKPELLKEFFPLFQMGVRVNARVGCSIAMLLCEGFGLDEGYVERRITTIFLDSRPIDDVHRATVKDGSTIALSGAMPGLVGATMRCGGYYAAMRGVITHREGDEAGMEQGGTVRIKLFNLLLPELAPVFLGQGIILGADDLRAYLAGRPDPFLRGCNCALLDNEPIRLLPPQEGLFPSGGTVLLTVSFKENRP
jgi:hypothetical protein